MTDLTRLTAAELASSLASGEISSVEATRAHLDRIAAVDADIHAFLHVSDHALELTPAQTRAMNDELAAVIERYRVEGPAEEGDVQQVLVLLDAFPVREVRL